VPQDLAVTLAGHDRELELRRFRDPARDPGDQLLLRRPLLAELPGQRHLTEEEVGIDLVDALLIAPVLSHP